MKEVDTIKRGGLCDIVYEMSACVCVWGCGGGGGVGGVGVGGGRGGVLGWGAAMMRRSVGEDDGS